MLKHYLQSAFRGVARNKSYTIINVVGLAAGFVTCLIIALWVAGELSYERCHANADSIYRVTYDVTIGTRYRASATCMAPLAPAAVTQLPSVAVGTRFRAGGAAWLSYEDRALKVPQLLYADTSFFDVFSFTPLAGLPRQDLHAPYAAVLSKQTADRLFGTTDPIGHVIRVGDDMRCTVTGVAEDCPPNSHIRFDILVSFATLIAEDPDVTTQWGRFGHYTYLLVAPGTEPSALERELNELADEHLSPILDPRGIELNLHLQRLTDIHLRSKLESELSDNGSMTAVYTYSAIALAVLLMASLNFISLATARAAARGVEVRLRKAIGATRRDVIYQSTVEALLIHAIALAGAIVTLCVFAASYGDVLGVAIIVPGSDMLIVACVAAAGWLLYGAITGLVPALYLTRQMNIRNRFAGAGHGRSGLYARRVIVVLQFTAVTALIIGILMISKQVRYLQHKDLGFDREGLLLLAGLSGMRDRSLETFRDEIQRLPGVRSASLTTSAPVSGPFPLTTYVLEGEPESEGQLLVSIAGDAAYVNTLGLAVVHGRGFSAQLAIDSTDAVLINETAASLLGGTGAVGKTISHTTQTAEGIVAATHQIIGIVRDFNFKTLHGVIEPLVIARAPLIRMHPFNQVVVRLEKGAAQGVIANIVELWRHFTEDTPLEYEFLDDVLANRYARERHVLALVIGFGALAVLVGCLGLLGMISHSAARRMKEIAVRKTVGADRRNIVAILLRETAVSALLSGAFACPIAYHFVQAWYSKFAYHATAGPEIYVLACVISLVIAVLTTLYHSIRAALTSPVSVLRCE